MIENVAKVFPKLMLSLEIKSLILNCGGSIDSKKCKGVRSCVKDRVAILEFQGWNSGEI